MAAGGGATGMKPVKHEIENSMKRKKTGRRRRRSAGGKVTTSTARFTHSGTPTDVSSGQSTVAGSKPQAASVYFCLKSNVMNC